jgi:hypothetical protein
MSFLFQFAPIEDISFGFHTKSRNISFALAKKCFADANNLLRLIFVYLKNEPFAT